MISDTAAILFILIALISIAFMIWCFIPRKQMLLLHKLYFALCGTFAFWCIIMLAMKYTDPGDMKALFALDALTYISVSFSPVLMLMVAMTFVKGLDKMPKSWLLLFIVPVLTNIVVWTNDLHHLQYVVFSVRRSEIVFGPYIYFSGAYNYICTVIAIVGMLRFGIKNQSRLYMMQGVVFALSDSIPLVVSITATLGLVDLPITATPLSYAFVLIGHYMAIYQLHLLDITPIATQKVLDWITDCYLVLSDKGLVVSCNEPFRDVFGLQYGIAENKFLRSCVKAEDISGKTAIYNLLTAVESCRDSHSAISYEQSVSMQLENGDYQKLYYIADITPLLIRDRLAGFVVMFKDFTEVKKSMQQVQDSQRHMMEQERLAFLGQMVGGLAHNLKTPIMSISGCMNAIETLASEADESFDDPEVTPDDYREMLSELRGWTEKTRESCAYMSDIITAIKGQAANVTTSQEDVFTLDELIKRSTLLMRHELLSGGCQLIPDYDPDAEITLTGDINNLVQVINNLVSNAIYAEQKTENEKKIYIGVEQGEGSVSIYVRDTGPGVDPRVRDRLFNEMITNKGAGGTGLGLYISNVVVRGKFGGSMWVRDDPAGGAVFGFSIPLDRISVRQSRPGEGA